MSVSISIHGQVIDAVADRCRSLGLDAIADTSIVVRKVPWNRSLTAPGMFVTLGSKVVSTTGYGGLIATNQSNVVGYGVQVTLLRASNQELALDDAWLLWRERVEDAFQPTTSPPLPAVTDIETILIEPGPTLDPGLFAAGYDVQALVVRAVGRRRRGLE